MTGSRPSDSYYNRHASALGEQYGRVKFEDVHGDIQPFLPASGSLILDVGAGSGRDAAALADLDYRVTAVEPAGKLAEWGRDRYSDRAIEWIDDALPDLAAVRALCRRYRFILCSAVLMHIPADALARSFKALAALLDHQGCLAVSVRDRIATDASDIFHSHGDEALIEAARCAGLGLMIYRQTADRLGRPLVWRSLLFADRSHSS